MMMLSRVVGFFGLLLPATMGFLLPTPLSTRRPTTMMALDPELSKTYPRDFKNIPLGTNYGEEES